MVPEQLHFALAKLTFVKTRSVMLLTKKSIPGEPYEFQILAEGCYSMAAGRSRMAAAVIDTAKVQGQRKLSTPKNGTNSIAPYSRATHFQGRNL